MIEKKCNSCNSVFIWSYKIIMLILMLLIFYLSIYYYYKSLNNIRHNDEGSRKIN